MGTITANIKDDTEQEFREAVKNQYGEGKGTLGRALDEAMKMWAEEKGQATLKVRALNRLKKGYNLGGLTYKKREELYER